VKEAVKDKKIPRTLSQAEIAALLPQTAPFLLVDRVTELEPGRRGKGIRNVTANDMHLLGHFPGKPIMPGVLIVESCGQLAALVCATEEPGDSAGNGGGRAASAEDNREKPLSILAMIERFKFLRLVSPGDQMILEAEIGKRFQDMIRIIVSARVGSHLVAEGVLVATKG
jgi:3-hydroxymyristoyl/3-hydroxydecanoyl-(acyl carrier protein) dehydratase